MFRALLFLAGWGLVVGGVWVGVAPWVALIVAGVCVSGTALLLELAAVRREAGEGKS